MGDLRLLTIDELVERGVITAEEAEKAKRQVESPPPPPSEDK